MANQRLKQVLSAKKDKEVSVKAGGSGGETVDSWFESELVRNNKPTTPDT